MLFLQKRLEELKELTKSGQLDASVDTAVDDIMNQQKVDPQLFAFRERVARAPTQVIRYNRVCFCHAT